MTAQKRKKKLLVEIFWHFLMPTKPNPTNQYSKLSWFFQTIQKAKSHVQHFTLFNYCWFIIVARCPRQSWEDYMNHQMTFMPFIGSQTFKLSLWKLTVEQYFKSRANKSNSQEPPFLHFFQYDPEEVRVLANLIFLVLG